MDCNRFHDIGIGSVYVVYHIVELGNENSRPRYQFFPLVDFASRVASAGMAHGSPALFRTATGSDLRARLQGLRLFLSELDFVTILAVTVVWPVLQMVAADAIFDARLGSPMVLTQEEQGWANSAYWAEFDHRHWVNAKGDMFELIVEAHATQVASRPLQMMLKHC
jgi:hypothetical protein